MLEALPNYTLFQLYICYLYINICDLQVIMQYNVNAVYGVKFRSTKHIGNGCSKHIYTFEMTFFFLKRDHTVYDLVRIAGYAGMLHLMDSFVFV